MRFYRWITAYDDDQVRYVWPISLLAACVLAGFVFKASSLPFVLLVVAGATSLIAMAPFRTGAALQFLAKSMASMCAGVLTLFASVIFAYAIDAPEVEVIDDGSGRWIGALLVATFVAYANTFLLVARIGHTDAERLEAALAPQVEPTVKQSLDAQSPRGTHRPPLWILMAVGFGFLLGRKGKSLTKPARPVRRRS